MTYAETRDEETLRLLKPLMDEFIRNCHRHANATAGARQTVFFLPGGMASRLTRATEKFEDDDPDPQTFDYETVWVTLETPFGGAQDLAMHLDNDNTFRDEGDRIIVADAALSLDLFGRECTPHDGFITWCRDNNINLFVFPWDWRRRLDEIVTFFVSKFLPCFQSYVMSQGCPDPLERYAIVGHSFGGMIANLILRNPQVNQDQLTHVITVATPFYGYAGQLHRWFEGDDYVNFFGVLEKQMMRMIATLPGLYTLHFLDDETFETNREALSQRPFPIPGYPSLDSRQKGQHADPYNPYRDGTKVRYPRLSGFDLQELDYAERQFKELASPLEPPERLKKFHNIRGVTTTVFNISLANTIGSVTWDWIPQNYDADDPTPIHNGKKLPGDGTQPAWTTCLVTNRERCVTVKGPTIDHGFMMNHTGVIEEIQNILFLDGGAVRPKKTREPKPASDKDIVDVLTWLSGHLLTIKRMKSRDVSQLKNLPEYKKFESKIPGVARRFISDVMKRPGPEGLRPPEGRHRKAPKRKRR